MFWYTVSRVGFTKHVNIEVDPETHQTLRLKHIHTHWNHRNLRFMSFLRYAGWSRRATVAPWSGPWPSTTTTRCAHPPKRGTRSWRQSTACWRHSHYHPHHWQQNPRQNWRQNTRDQRRRRQQQLHRKQQQHRIQELVCWLYYISSFDIIY